MPEPEEAADVVVPPTPPMEATSSRASFASCPPEEDRDAHAPRQSREEATSLTQSAANGDTMDDGRESVRQEPTPEPEVHLGAEREKGEHVEDARIGVEEREASSAPSPEVQGESEVRSTQPVGSEEARGREEDNAPLYLSYPPIRRDRLHPNAWSSFLYPGSKFRGTQQSDRQEYDVQVEIKNVDLVESQLCGYLRIQGLTDDHPTLTTFFEGEIIGPKYLFRTSHSTWNSSEKIDLQHWARFPSFRPLAKAARASPSTFTLKNYLEREHLFMRWKEYFLVPDHRVKSISGASFEGFYYICFDQTVGSVSGIYFHAKSEKYQQLELKHVEAGGCQGAVEFR